jgi:two-component system sensor histidine kinase KdpD
MPKAQPPTRSDAPAGGGWAVAVAAALALCAVLVGLGLTPPKLLDPSVLATLLMAVVLVVAVAFGLGLGLAVALLGLIAFQLSIGAPLTRVELHAADLPLVGLFAVGVLVAGRYTDVVRKRDSQARKLLEAGQPLSSHASEPALGRFLQQIKLDGPLEADGTPLKDAQRALVTLCIVTAGMVAALLANETIGPAAAGVCALSAVLVAGGALGGRFGFAAGLLAAVAFDRVDPLPHAAHAGFDSLGRAVVGLAFVGAGWAVGQLADQAQRERRGLRIVIKAGRDFSATRDEAAMRRALLEVVARLSPRTRVEVGSDLASERLSLQALPEPEQWAESDPRWRSHPLASDGRQVGVVRWRFPGPDRATAGLDEITRAVADLAASAIVRARLNAEKADIELVAQTEHLRLVLLDTVSHHFRSPLAGILGSVTSILGLSDDHDPAARRELLLIIKEQASRLSRYVDNFLSVARLDTGAIVPRLADVALEPLIYDVWEAFGEAGGARRFLQATVDRETLRTDPGLLSQVLGNVLENAIKYSPEGSVVDVRADTEGDRLLIRVTDCGPGVPPKSQGQIFERFYRMRGVAAAGLGLGLYITRSLVEILGGAVEARNRTDGQTGLVVCVSLPLNREADDE